MNNSKEVDDQLISQIKIEDVPDKELEITIPNKKIKLSKLDHVDLQAAMDRKVDVVEVTYCNSRSVAEHIVMMIVSMVRDYHTQYAIVNNGGWNIADAVQRSYDVEGMHIGMQLVELDYKKDEAI